MKRMKKIAYGGLLFGASLMLLGGCGSNHQSKETTASSLQTESSSKEKDSEVKDPDSGENHHITLDNPFQKNIPQYVCDGDDQNRRVKAIIIPYGDNKDEIKVTTYNNGEVDKSYIVPYKIKKVTDGDKEHLPIYQYSFYDNSDHTWRNFDVTQVSFKDIPNQYFFTMMELDVTDKPNTAKNKSEQEMKDDFRSGRGVVLYDDRNVVLMK